jgi:hypothetical protein
VHVCVCVLAVVGVERCGSQPGCEVCMCGFVWVCVGARVLACACMC